MKIELMFCTDVLLEEICNPKMKKRAVAQSYALALRSSEEKDWLKINRAIIDRWGRSGLECIKNMAWSGDAFGRRK